MRREILELVVCPACIGELEQKHPTWTSEDRLSFGLLVCSKCDIKYTVVDDIAILREPGWIGWEEYIEGLRQRTDEWQQWFWQFDGEIQNSYKPQEREADKQVRAGIIARSGVEEADTVLDIATGRGLLLREMCPAAHEDALIVATDIGYYWSVGLKWHYQSVGTYDRISFVLCDAKKLPFRDDTFGTVVSLGALTNISEPELAVKEAYRVVRPGQKVATSHFMAAEGSETWKRAMELGCGGLLTEGKAEECFRKVGFEGVSSEQYYSAIASYQNPYNALPIEGDWHATGILWGTK